jgi:hypothetical protein
VDIVPGHKLGRLPPRRDLRTAHFIDFLHRPALPACPPARDWDEKLPADLGMFANDQVGCCGFAGMAHAHQTWTATPGPAARFTDDDVLGAYSACTGYRRDNPRTDRGVVLLDALKFWRKTGVSNHKIYAFLSVDPQNLAHCRLAVALFGGLYIGAELPVSAQRPGPWIGWKKDLIGSNRPGTWGGHCMWACGYDRQGFDLVTWGARQACDDQWWANYVDEAYVCLSLDWATPTRKSPSGFDAAKLQAFMAALG